MKYPDNLDRYTTYFSDSDFWDKVKSVAKKAGIKAIYVALVLYYALQDPKVSKKDKTLILGALGYFILPLDLIPDFLPGVGFSDDIFALVLAFVKVKQSINDDVKERAKETLHRWFGNYQENEIILDSNDYEIKS